MQVPSRLTIETVTPLFKNGLQSDIKTPLVVDLAQVETVDSAAVSLLLAWLREAQRSSVKLCFDHVPENLLSLARLYGVVDMLPLCGNDSAQS
ncbi:Phospholipid transport system transporter-binding protein [Candidatus Nitrotoga sp. BS]|uniref:STAS domain-containing protein n=1 Tax=Candidatus Nitrotoga sp. BS TaxID=2890408 RepID=UPI001EF2378A|nr:STAS domain-containing protein [Candidatus Nitrotoga sp. BS]CAH1203394.1 Phospholipid transport system transporter-binding protein [Candidatus Nitrotoga sp. BS]